MPKQKKDKDTAFSSGARRSEKLPNTTRIPQGFLELIARRGDEGEVKYGRFNYRKGLLDRDFIEQGFAHGLKHLQELSNHYHNHGDFPHQTDDDLAGAAWALMMLWEAREKHRDAVPA
jgi:hypothetical protein